MKKTSIYLEPELDRALELLAERQGVTKAEAIRAALREAVTDVKRPRLTAIGVGRGPGDVGRNVDKYLDGFGEW
jgi:predicted transcriptional regulator